MSLDQLRVTPALQRPGSSLSHRSVSRASQRPVSRLSQRSRQPRLATLLNTLVKQVTGLDAEHDSEDIQEAVEVASKRIDQMKQGSVPDLTEIETQFRGHVKKARINTQDMLADLLQAKYSELKLNVAQHKDLDAEIKLSTLPHHLQLLLLLSSRPADATLAQADAIYARDNAPVAHSPPLTWKKILEEEPFEGQHWQGAYGLPEGSTVEKWEEESSDSDFSSLLQGITSPDDVTSSSEDEPLHRRPQEDQRQKLNKYGGREIVETLQAQQYWRSGWSTDADLGRPFDIGDPSTLGPAVSRVVMRGTASFAGPDREAYINEIDAVREVLMALQGRKSCLFQVQPDSSVTVLHYHRLVHLTRTAQASVLESFASYASTLNPLRDLVHQSHETAVSSPSSTRCRTFEAFSAAIDRQLLRFDKWCAEREERICLSQHGEASSSNVVSLLSLEKAVGVKLARTFHTLLKITSSIEARRQRLSPCTLTALVLNSLLEAVRTRSAIGDMNTAQVLMDIWRESTEPLWENVRRWLKDGIPIRSGFEGETYTTEPTWDTKEFFIRINPLMDIASPDFWESGYTLLPCHQRTVSRDPGGEGGAEESGVPTFLQHVVEDLLAAGKAIGLLRALGMVHLVGDDWLEGWSNFGTLTETLSLRGLDEVLENMMSESLIPSCRLAQSWFRTVLVDDCSLWRHVEGLQQVYLMTRGDAMSHFGEILFDRMDTGQPWNDFHFLNSAFRDVSKYGSTPWINPALVRISHRGTKDRNISRTVRAIDGLSVEYMVPFPLTYMFGPETTANYSSIFGFLLQIKRSKGVLDRILIRGLNNGALDYSMPDLKAFYALRTKLSWFVNTLLNFIMTNVIHAGLIEFQDALRKAVSLDEMIIVHQSHLERLLGRCLLQDNTSALHRAILSILDLSLHFSDCLSAFAGDTSLDISRRSLLVMRHRHRRRERGGRRQKPDVIGFADALPQSEDDDESADETVEPSISAAGASISFTEEGFLARLEKMDNELDGLVRFIRHGVESLAGGFVGVKGEAAATFGILAFSLGDWTL